MAAGQFQHRLRIAVLGAGLEGFEVFGRNENQLLGNGGWKVVGGQGFDLGRRGRLRNIPRAQHAHFDFFLWVIAGRCEFAAPHLPRAKCAAGHQQQYHTRQRHAASGGFGCGVYRSGSGICPGNCCRLGGHLHVSAQRHPGVFAFFDGPVFHRQHTGGDVLLEFIARKRAEMPAVFLDVVRGHSSLRPRKLAEVAPENHPENRPPLSRDPSAARRWDEERDCSDRWNPPACPNCGLF